MVENPSPTEWKAEASAVHVKEKAEDITAIREKQIDSRVGHNQTGGGGSQCSVDLEHTKSFPEMKKRNCTWESKGHTDTVYCLLLTFNVSEYFTCSTKI